MAFATFTAVNDTALHVAVANTALEAVVQNSLFLDGVGITQIVGSDVRAGGIRVPKLVVASGNFRKLGATTNGGWFDTTAIVAKGVDEEFIELLYLYNLAEDVPASQSALSVGGWANVESRAKMIGKQIAKQMNAGTLATMLVANLNAVVAASGTETGYIYTYTPATAGDAYKYFVTACSGLDDGDTYNAYFPIEGRLALIRSEFETTLKTITTNVIVGGSNFAQEMRAHGGLSPDAKLPENINGWRGFVNGVPTFLCSKQIWDLAEDWTCVLSTHTAVSSGYYDNITAVICSHIATLRAHAFPESFKVIDAPTGQGVRIQPESNFGCKTVFPLGVKLLAKATFVEGSAPLEVLPVGSQA